MRVTTRALNLHTRHPFVISRAGSRAFHNLLVEVEWDGLVGRGEAAPESFYGETAATVPVAVGVLTEEWGDDPFAVEGITVGWEKRLKGHPAAKAALEMALHDLVGQRVGLPLYRFWGLNPASAPMTSFTIGIDETARMVEKVQEAADFPLLKVKLGTDRDEEIIRSIREVTDRPIRVDANTAWTPKEAVEKLHALEPYALELVEQPVAAGDLEGLRYIRDRVKVPIIVDESVRRAEDIPRLVGYVDGINIKLMKSGGLREALRMIHVARAHGLRVMLGSMIESSLANTAAAHLAALVDYVDLDGHLLIENDPFRGLRVDRGRLVLPDRPGLGVEPRT